MKARLISVDTAILVFAEARIWWKEEKKKLSKKNFSGFHSDNRFNAIKCSSLCHVYRLLIGQLFTNHFCERESRPPTTSCHDSGFIFHGLGLFTESYLCVCVFFFSFLFYLMLSSWSCRFLYAHTLAHLIGHYSAWRLVVKHFANVFFLFFSFQDARMNICHVMRRCWTRSFVRHLEGRKRISAVFFLMERHRG